MKIRTGSEKVNLKILKNEVVFQKLNKISQLNLIKILKDKTYCKIFTFFKTLIQNMHSYHSKCFLSCIVVRSLQNNFEKNK